MSRRSLHLCEREWARQERSREKRAERLARKRAKRRQAGDGRGFQAASTKAAAERGVLP
jgi:hypothetical protein